MSRGWTGLVLRFDCQRIGRSVLIGHQETFETHDEMSCGFRGVRWVLRATIAKAKKMESNILHQKMKAYKKLYESTGRYTFKNTARENRDE